VSRPRSAPRLASPHLASPHLASPYLASPYLASTVAVVTGGSRGLGRLLSQALAQAGASVGLIARSADELAAAVREITQAGGRAIAATGDVSRPDDVERAIGQIRGQLGPIGLLVNSAGIAGPSGNIWDLRPDAWWETVQVNLGSAYQCTRAVLPEMIAREDGRIVNITSNAGVYRWPQQTAYAVSKAAIIKLTENVAAETRASGVRVFSVDPGLLPIGLTTSAIARTAAPGSGEARRDAWLRRQLAAGRGADPARAARLVVRIASGAADPLTGCHLSVHDDLDQMLVLAARSPDKDIYQLRRTQPARSGQVRSQVPDAG
jgi:NAD(P)-dependent dehydrogenase (short-subunit alcohol dehydrogenase family)